MNRRTLLTLILVLLTLVGCATGKKHDDETASAASLYEKGKEALESGYFETAIEQFELLEARYPFGEYAQQAQLDLAYAYYKFDNPESAIAVADRYIKTYPRHPNVDYAYYIRGLANFDQASDFFSRLLDEDVAKRDPGAAQESFRHFAELLERFPDSRYAPDARQRMIFLKNYLARHEIHVAHFYMRRGAYIAVIKRCQNVLETYPRTTSIPDALALMVDAYKILGLEPLAAEADSVLKINYPDYQRPRRRHFFNWWQKQEVE
ncbi:MAG TPA: outer membrane protein assembly factor BamD [Gammaproteobacteria bacterium]|nr:outer membrane protein assembly factor BamD [Gammaproteobacteria bacterium]